ncbi:Uncharacterized protein TCAP_05209 [Tolypocladium capitatum]|uniref:Uncharacterized protein n=1 Tax=Tolypocladium capitatum TaxID=45235 RepID=A0A2K3QBE6_9HYPO|nr:Uncharacterized protein TCAP_05209 [Tolypocladium capitatum]
MDGHGWDRARVAELWSRDFDLGSNSEASQGFTFQSNTTSALMNGLKLAAEKSTRTSFVILAAVNALVAVATAVGIFCDCYIRAKRRDPGFRLRSSLLSVVGPTETFPFVLSCGIMIQGIIFAVAQSMGLDSLLILGCAPISQLMLPALFVTPYIQLVFGLETALRALRRYSFPQRRKWAVPTCLGIVAAGLIGTYVLTRFVVPPNFCYAELLWTVQRWSLGCFALLTIIALSLLIASLITIAGVYRTSAISETNRACASWMACYMVLAAVTMSVMIPFFWNLYSNEAGELGTHGKKLSVVAAVAVNLSGLTTGGLYLILRATRLGRIGPRGYDEFYSQKSKTGRSPSTPIHWYTKQMEQPVSPVRFQRTEMNADMADEARNEEKVDSRPRTPPAVQFPPPTVQSSPPTAPDAAHMPAATTRRPSIRKDSYNVFPPNQEAPDVKSTYLLPAATYNPTTKAMAPAEPPIDVLLPPPTIRTSRHMRVESFGSSATVQIGLRVSNIDDMPLVTSYYQAPYTGESTFLTDYGPTIPTDVDSSAVGATQGVDLENANKVLEGPSRPPEKLLPPVPLRTAKKDTKNDENETRPSLDVYSPLTQPRRESGHGNKTVIPRGSPTRPPPPPGPSWSSDGRPRFESMEWI